MADGRYVIRGANPKKFERHDIRPHVNLEIAIQRDEEDFLRVLVEDLCQDIEENGGFVSKALSGRGLGAVSLGRLVEKYPWVTPAFDAAVRTARERKVVRLFEATEQSAFDLDPENKAGHHDRKLLAHMLGVVGPVSKERVRGDHSGLLKAERDDSEEGAMAGLASFLKGVFGEQLTKMAKGGSGNPGNVIDIGPKKLPVEVDENGD